MPTSLILFAMYFGVSGDHAIVKPLTIWEGRLETAKYGSQSAFVIDQRQWQQVWERWSKEKLPTIDFSREMVLVFSTVGANRITVDQITLDSTGNLRVFALQTLLPGEGLSYKLVHVPRAGLKTVNRTPVK